jgi:hypothetical protein
MSEKRQLLLKIAHHYGELSSLFAQMAAEGNPKPEVKTEPRAENGDRQVYCDCGEPAKLIEKVTNGKPWTAYGCEKPKSLSCGYFKFSNKLDEADYQKREAF